MNPKNHEITVTEEHTLDTEQMPENAKELINNLLWAILPGNTTLREADDIALDLWQKVINLWSKP